MRHVKVTRSQSQLYFFNRNKNEDEKKGDSGDEEDKKPFFARILDRTKPPPATERTKPAPAKENPAKESPAAPVAVKAKEGPKKEESAVSKAQALRAQAERMRLEAERMDAQLTLDKIERLERDLAHAKKKGESVEELQREMEALQAKVRGEAPKAKVVSTPAQKQQQVTSTVDTYTPAPMATTDAQPVDKKKFQEYLETYENAPGVMKGLMAGTVGLYSADSSDINATEVALRMEMVERSDYSFLKDVPKPSFSEKEIERVKKSPLFKMNMMAEKESEDVVATKLLEDQYYTEIMTREMNKAMEESPFFEIEIQNMTDLDQMTYSLFPKATRKEGETPTMAEAMTLLNNVLPKAGFSPSGKPEPILGGYLIRGTNKKKDANTLIESIDASLAASSIRGKLSVFFIKDYTVFTDEQIESADFNPADADPILMVTGSNVYREPRRILYSAVSAIGIASSWYLSIYPFLLNPDIMKRAEDQMSLADANMSYDLTWLTDLSLPLFATFMGIQFAHEIGHRVVAAAYDVSCFDVFCTSLHSSIRTHAYLGHFR